MRPQKTDLMISGAGIAGLTLACLLGRLGLHIIICDPNDPLKAPDKDGLTRTAALMDGSLHVLQGAGIGTWCEEQGTPMTGLRIIENSPHQSKPVTSLFQAQEIGQKRFGLNLPIAPLRHKLAQTAASIDTVQIISGAVLQDFEAETAHIDVYLDNGQHIETPLLIGADGRNSAVRQLAGITSHEKDYLQSALTCLIKHDLPHENISTEFYRTGGPFTLVPLSGNRSSIVWVDRSEGIEELMTLPADALSDQIQAASTGLLGKIKLESKPQSWPLKMVRADRLSAQRLALIAEAAHVITPLGAQGLNLSLRDVAALAEITSDAVYAGQDIGAAHILGRYEKRRRRDIMLRTGGTDILNRIVRSAHPAIHMVRRKGLQLLDRQRQVRHILMQQGMAPIDPEARLERGQPLLLTRPREHRA